MFYSQNQINYLQGFYRVLVDVRVLTALVGLREGIKLSKPQLKPRVRKRKRKRGDETSNQAASCGG